ncbi:uncharacterized protein G2W53_009943 [Senna tora]|uniref:Reverse transcriptase domain-containing protein n=1 Tax=Senna tora TaxID=362788 RepID=A0A834WZ98_9FABA|nr:uncharacterized protein G2W53_009943 [Senna tora]
MSVRVVFANRSGFDVPIGFVMAWEEPGSCLDIFQMTNRSRISERFTNYEAKDLLRKLVRVLFANRSGSNAPIGVVMAWEERGSCLNIFRMTNRCRISETFTNYKAKHLLRKVVMAWEERGSCINIFRTTNRVRISETFTNYEAKHLLRKCVKHVDEKSRSDLRNLHELRGKTLVAQLSETRQFALYLRTGVVLMLQLESLWHGRSVDHVLTYFGLQIAIGSQKLSRIMRQNTCCEIAFTDDNLVYSKDREDHFKILLHVLREKQLHTKLAIANL